jgi:hypothetical protein
MFVKAWKLVLPALVLIFALPGALAADEGAPTDAALPEVVREVPPEVVTPVPAEDPALPDLQPAPAPMVDCYSLSTCTTSFAACESWCYSQNCGVNYWDSGMQICYCGTRF